MHWPELYAKLREHAVPQNCAVHCRILPISDMLTMQCLLVTMMLNYKQITIRVNKTCKEYGMEMNVKKTKTMVISKSDNMCCKIMINCTTLEQVP